MIENINQMITSFYPQRNLWVHKGDFGYVLVVAGSQKYSGSPIFNAMGALRAGADIVVLRGHPRAMDIAARYSPDIITEPFSTDFNSEVVSEILEMIPRFQSVVVGCGLPRTEETFSAIRALVEKNELPLVLDAEAIRAVAGHTEILKDKKIVLTPNSEEFRILTGEEVSRDEQGRKEKVEKWARELGVIILLKGHVDIISDGVRTYMNNTGSVFMTKGGFGDVLAGILGALLARSGDLFETACVAAYINGRAGTLAGDTYGEGVLASDSFEFIPLAIKEHIQSE